MKLLLRIQARSDAALLFNGLIANVSMFVYESHRCLVALSPDDRNIFSSSDIELLRVPRHRAKLLDSTKGTVAEVAIELGAIVKKQRDVFLKPHSGFWGPLKRVLQPDMGLSIYNNHIFTTTHSTIFAFGEDYDISENAFALGMAIGVYIARFLKRFQIDIPKFVEPVNLPGSIEMRDIKYEALYNRGCLGANSIDISSGLIFILANLNFARYILPGVLPSESHTLFRLKFITAFHANSNIKSLQSKVMANKSGSVEIAEFFKEALGNSDSKWLQKQKSLRNLLTHYLPDQHVIPKLPTNATRLDAIECLGAGLSFEKIEALLDRHIVHLSGLLETGYNLAGDPFWLGKVR